MVRIKGHLRDLLAFKELVAERKRRFANSSKLPLGEDPIRRLVATLHPKQQKVVIDEVREETRDARTFKLVPDTAAGCERLAYFRAGQYLSLTETVGGSTVTRPYSIASAPVDALGGYYEITIKRVDDGFVTPHVWANWQPGTRLTTSGPGGQFYHDPLRDSGEVIAIAGGSGITPFRSMIREILHGDSQLNLTLFYGSARADGIIYGDELDRYAAESSGRVRVIHVISDDESAPERFETGFMTAELFGRHVDIKEQSFFICGPPVMYAFVRKELGDFDIPRRRIRSEVYGSTQLITDHPDFPPEAVGKTFSATVRKGGLSAELTVSAEESLLVALERGKLAPPSECRSGACSVCRVRVVDGDLFVNSDADGRRAADRKLGFVHACDAYPTSDLTIEIG